MFLADNEVLLFISIGGKQFNVSSIDRLSLPQIIISENLKNVIFFYTFVQFAKAPFYASFSSFINHLRVLNSQQITKNF